jgi:hypothetical protein
MFTKRFWVDATERAAATFAQALLALIGTNAVDLVTITIGEAFLASAVAAVISVAKSLAALHVPGANGSASLLNQED